MSVYIQLSNNSVSNTTATCDSLGIHYDISKVNHRVVSVKKWDRTINQDLTVGEFKFHFFRRNQIRMRGDGKWMPITDFLRKGGSWSAVRIFRGNDGNDYKWTKRKGKLVVVEASQNARKSQPLVKYHRHYGRTPSYLEIIDKSMLTSLDEIILSFLLVEKQRREAETQVAAAAVAASATGATTTATATA
ncbi:hypothetical protein CPB86DRAFT_788551 [Serendipita vermifera]|nr:hypothetical protein CPB86DRAFT_788551 [Serendipita vermifera]